MLADNTIDHWLVEDIFVPEISMPGISYNCCLNDPVFGKMIESQNR